MLTRLPTALVAHCVGMLTAAGHGVVAQTCRFMNRVVVLPAAVTRRVTYARGLDAATGFLPVGLRRLPLHRLDVREARLTVDAIVGAPGDGGGGDGDGTADAAMSKTFKIGGGGGSGDSSVAWIDTLRDLTVSTRHFFEPHVLLLRSPSSSPRIAAAVRGECLRRLTRLETLRIAQTAAHDTYDYHHADVLAAKHLGRVLCGFSVAGSALRRLEMRVPAIIDFSALSALPQLEVLVIERGRSDKYTATLPRLMPNLRALSIPGCAKPPWPAYPALEELMYAGEGRLPPNFASHLTDCATGGRLRRLSLASYHWLPARTLALLIAAHSSVTVIEVGANASIDHRVSRDLATWHIDARHLAQCLAARTGHKTADVTTAEIQQWAATGPAVVATSLLDF
jgi:hypothetical protein